MQTPVLHSPPCMQGQHRRNGYNYTLPDQDAKWLLSLPITNTLYAEYTRVDGYGMTGYTRRHQGTMCLDDSMGCTFPTSTLLLESGKFQKA